MRRITLSIATGATLLWGSTAAALTPAEKCEADKLKRAGLYSSCRLKAESKAVKTSSAPDYSRCDSKLSQKWAAAETSAGGMCPTNGDLTSMQERITAETTNITGCLNGTCPPSYVLLPATGQLTAYGAGSDGDVRAGAALSYTDNGDGTITDNYTGLIWEKKSDDGSIHDWDNQYTWGMVSPPYTMNGTMVTDFLDALNDAGGGGVNCFAGHCDWRIPNIKELQSIVNYEIPYPGPTVAPAFHTGCVASCTVVSCSCSQSWYYWSSSTYQSNPGNAWNLYFGDGYVNASSKSTNFYYVRAVRGGL